ncbi:MAG: hypothetical protein ACTHNU_00635 [Gaiellales bacterium]
MQDRSPSAEVIADRYLTSPSRLRARPFGPVDALDTHAGRAAQVRIVFTSADWDEPELADAVARWCGIGAAGVCGVLDFGRHGDRWFLVLPPSLGTPVERWRSMRRPGPADAAGLALSFGRLLESVAAAGFDAGSAVVADFAVGPGPTPFLEQPLLTSPRTAVPISRRAGGQAVLAALFDGALHDRELPPELEAWRSAAAAESHPDLAACLDSLERAQACVRASVAVSEPAGVAGIFDGPLTLPDRAPWADRLRRVGPVAALLPLLVVGLALALAVRHPAVAKAPPPPAAAPHTRLAANPSPKAPPTARSSRKPVHRTARARHRSTAAAYLRRRRRPNPVAHRSTARAARPSAPVSTRSSPSTAAPPAPAAPPASPTSSSRSGVVLPTPGGTVLPHP